MKYTYDELLILDDKMTQLAKKLNINYKSTAKDFNYIKNDHNAIKSKYLKLNEIYQNFLSIEEQLENQHQITERNNTYSGLYPGSLQFNDFPELIEIESKSQDKSLPIYLLFNTNFIKNFFKADNKIQIMFLNTINKGISFCKSKGEPGIKNLKNSQILVETDINNEPYKTFISHEIKILKRPDRIGLYLLKPKLGSGPIILVAGVYIENGFKKEKNKKLLHSKIKLSSLIIDKFVDNKKPVADLLNKQGFFTTKSNDGNPSFKNQDLLADRYSKIHLE